jgi:hypothetical protein
MKQEYSELQRHIASLVGKEAFASPRGPLFLVSEIPETPKVVSMTRDLIKTTQAGHAFKVFDKEGMGRNEAGAAYQRLVEEVLKRASIN